VPPPGAPAKVPVETIKEVPVDKIIERVCPVEVVQQVEVPIERIVERVVEVLGRPRVSPPLLSPDGIPDG